MKHANNNTSIEQILVILKDLVLIKFFILVKMRLCRGEGRGGQGWGERGEGGRGGRGGRGWSGLQVKLIDLKSG